MQLSDNNNTENNHICIAPLGCDFRGAGAGNVSISCMLKKQKYWKVF